MKSQKGVTTYFLRKRSLPFRFRNSKRPHPRALKHTMTNGGLMFDQRRRRWSNIGFSWDPSVMLTDIVFEQSLIQARPANTGYIPNIGSILVHRLRRWPNIKPTLGQRPFAGARTSSARCRQVFIAQHQEVSFRRRQVFFHIQIYELFATQTLSQC